MNKLSVAVGVVAISLVSVSGGASAACEANIRLNYGQVLSVLPGKTACARQGNDWKYQELHQGTPGSSTTGDLVDYKKGPGDKVDPSKKVGSWALVRTGQGQGQGAPVTVTYTYSAFGPAQAYPGHTVHGSAATGYGICLSGTEVARLQNGAAGCQ